eukprot:6181649-Pleurochrysis_carterae.AAC.4
MSAFRRASASVRISVAPPCKWKRARVCARLSHLAPDARVALRRGFGEDSRAGEAKATSGGEGRLAPKGLEGKRGAKRRKHAATRLEGVDRARHLARLPSGERGG